MKGVGTTIAGIIISLMILISTVFIMVLLFKNTEKERKLNLEEAQIIRTKNVFYLFNKSLATTMAVSSAQVLFAAENLQEFWYKTDPSLPKSIVIPVGSATSSCPYPNGLLIYVDKQVALPSGYAPSDLVPFGNSQVRSVIVSDLNAMISAAGAEGITLTVVSAYRSYETQRSVFESYVQQEMANGYSREEAEARVNTYSARPGHSEHQLGTAIDFNSVDNNYWQTSEGQQIKSWLEQHADKYGFVLSYPTDPNNLKKTGYVYEPWHYRHVGKDIGIELKSLDYINANNDWTLNKYLTERCTSNIQISSTCNNGNPQICLPHAADASVYMREKMRNEYIEKMKKEIDLEGMIISFSVPSKNDAILIWPAYDSVKSRIQESIIIDSKPDLDVSTSTNATLKTSYRKMLHGGWLLVDMAMKIMGSGTANDYKNSVEAVIDTNINGISDWLGSDVVLENEKAIDFIVPQGGMMQPQSGLLLHYRINVTMKDAVPGVASYICSSVSDYDLMISDAVRSYKLYLSTSEAESLVKAIIQQESKWDPDAESDAGAIGLMQVVPQYHPECTGDLKDPKTNIECGVAYLNKLLNRYKKGDNINSIKLALAGYNCGEGCLDRAIKAADSDKWEEVASYVPQETQNYVSSVLSCYGYYSGENSVTIATVETPQWPTNTKIITDYFGSLWGIEEGYRTKPHTGIDIGAPAGEEVRPILSGTIEVAGQHSAYGNYVIVKHSQQLYSLYAHLSEISVKKGSKVTQSTIISKVGSTGSSIAPHLHLETRKDKDGNQFNPCLILACGETPKIISPSVFQSQQLSYYHDEKANRFVKKPFALRVVIEDYLPALDCTQNSGIFTLKNSNDILCYNGIIYLCMTTVEGAANVMTEGSVVGSFTCSQGEWK